MEKQQSKPRPYTSHKNNSSRNSTTTAHKTTSGEERTGDSVSPTNTECPECDGDLYPDGTELICGNCGLVAEVNDIDPGREWRTFTSEDMDSKPRTGAPRSELLHDHGLSTNISWQDSDGYGQNLNQSQRRRAKKLRKWQKYTRTSDSKDRNLKHAFGEISRMASALGVPKSIREVAGVTYRRAVSEDLLPGRSVEGMSTAALYYACRAEGSPRTLHQMTQVSRVDRDEIASAYRYMIRELELLAAPPDPENFINQIASSLGVDDNIRRYARNIVQTAKDNGLHGGKHPKGFAGAGIYTASMAVDGSDELTQKAVSEASDVCTVTIRSHHNEVLADCVETAPVPDTLDLSPKSVDLPFDIADYHMDLEYEHANFEIVDGTLTVMPKDNSTQSGVMIDCLTMLDDEFDLYSHIELPFKINKYTNEFIVESPSNAPEQSANWNKIGGNMYVTTKPEMGKKKKYIAHMCELFGLEVEFVGSWE